MSDFAETEYNFLEKMFITPENLTRSHTKLQFFIGFNFEDFFRQ